MAILIFIPNFSLWISVIWGLCKIPVFFIRSISEKIVMSGQQSDRECMGEEKTCQVPGSAKKKKKIQHMVTF